MIHNNNVLNDDEFILDNNMLYTYKTYTFEQLISNQRAIGLTLMDIANYDYQIEDYDHIIGKCCDCDDMFGKYKVMGFIFCLNCVDRSKLNNKERVDRGLPIFINKNNICCV